MLYPPHQCRLVRTVVLTATIMSCLAAPGRGHLSPSVHVPSAGPRTTPANQDEARAEMPAGLREAVRAATARQKGEDQPSADRYGAIVAADISVAVDGATAVVGYKYASYGISTGLAYVFVRTGTIWHLRQTLYASDRAADDYFGSSVAISGGTIVVGAPSHDTGGIDDAGAAYVFGQFGGVWVQQQQLVAFDGAQHDQFGSSVAISGDAIIVGAQNKDTNPAQPFIPGAGAAYAFTRSILGWTPQRLSIAGGGLLGDEFGVSVSVSGGVAVVGARGRSANRGAAHVFLWNGSSWVWHQQLVADDGAMNDQFGDSVAVSGGTVVVGAPRHDTPIDVEAGAAYVFVFNGASWAEQQQLTASDGAAVDFYGDSVAISGELVVVGARWHNVGGFPRAGAAYTYARSGGVWSAEQALVADSDFDTEMGYSVAISGETAVIGSLAANNAYVFVRCDPAWRLQYKLNPGTEPYHAAPEPVVRYAPYVRLHPNEQYLPGDPAAFIYNSSLAWSHGNGCPDGPVAPLHNVNPQRLGHWSNLRLPPYSHNPNYPTINAASCVHNNKVLFTAKERTRPYDEGRMKDTCNPRRDFWQEFEGFYEREGFYLNLLDDASVRSGTPSNSCDPGVYAGPAVFYEYVPGQYIDYWFFYAYNEYKTSGDGILPVPGLVLQSHEGDWEGISIQLDPTDAPLNVFYYSHGEGEQRSWIETEKLPGTDHPVVYTAVGSHASYPNAGLHCVFLCGDFDVASSNGPAWETWNSLADVTVQPWYGYGGAWGEVGDGITIPDIGSILGGDFTGPLGPSPWKNSRKRWGDDSCTPLRPGLRQL